MAINQHTDTSVLLPVSVLEQTVVLYTPVKVLFRLMDQYGLRVPEGKPFTTGLTLQVRSNTLILRPLSLSKLPALPFSPIRRTPEGTRISQCFAWGVVLKGARCHMQQVRFHLQANKLEGVLPSNQNRTWPANPGERPYYPAVETVRREIGLREPLRLSDLPRWAQMSLSPGERVILSRNGKL